jgi:1-acyl-sn-glycerol-3-phosphate acyltransferase
MTGESMPRRTVQEASAEKLLAGLEARVDARLEAGRERAREVQRERRAAAGSAGRILDAQTRLGDRIASLQSRIDALEQRRAKRSRRRPRVRLTEIGRLVKQARRLTRSESVDDFGFDRDFYDTLKPFIDFLFDRYFRVEAQGIAEHVPEQGPAILVANRGGVICYDAIMAAEAIRRVHPPRRLRYLLDELLGTAPALAPLLVRLGGVRDVKDNARRLLQNGEIVLFLEGGDRGKGVGARGELGAFPVEFAKLALATGAPVIPVAILGGEESQPVIGRAPALAKLLKLPDFPLTPTGLAPLPVKMRIRVEPPVALPARKRAHAAETLRDLARARIISMLHALRAERKSLLLG